MRKEDCFELGYLTKLHGLNGAISAHLDVDYPEAYLKLESVLLDVNGSLVPFFIDSVQIKGTKAILGFEDIKSPEEAETIIGLTMFLPLSFLPKLSNGQFYYHEVIGYSVEDGNQVIGSIENFNTGSAQTIIIVKQGKKEILIPMVDEFILSVNHTSKIFNVSLPEGLVDLYLEESDG